VTARVLLVVTSPRLPAGLLSASAWDALRAYPVYTSARGPQVDALEASGLVVTVVAADAETLLAAAVRHGTVVWLAGPGGDQALAGELGLRLARTPGLAELEVVYGSWDPPGARLLDAVAVMAALIAPEGDPWKRAQTHRSLAPFLLEEAYEAYDAITADDLPALREELGDVLLQVVLHSGLAERAGHWTVDDVAGELVDKLIRRNPHVFGDASVANLDEIVENWEQIKRAEKGRGSALDGIALSQPALALAAKVLSRAARAGIDVRVPRAAVDLSTMDNEVELGATLLALVMAAREKGLDAEAALRRATLNFAEAARTAERRDDAAGTAERRDDTAGTAERGDESG
jgi:NTP pyrophosphatase (non-canonical NTP hydrolase)